jgi:hypothetical protein
MTNKAEENLKDLHDAREALMLAEQALVRAMTGLGGETKRKEFSDQVTRAQGLLWRIAERIK